MQKFNYHTHTYRCGHAENISDEKFVQCFIKQGYTRITFTDHCPEKEKIDTRKNMRMEYSQKDEYLSSINSLKEKYKDVIKIESGFEVEYLPGQEENLLELKKESDKIILGQHFIYDNDNKNLKIFRWNDFTDNDLLKYAEYIQSAMKYNIPDIIAHPDLYMLSREKFGDIESKVANMICSSAEEYGIPLEINLAQSLLYLIKKRENIIYPCKEFWKIASEYRKLKVVYGIDAHYKEDIELSQKSLELANKHIGEEIIEKLHFCNEDLEVE